MKTPNFIRYFLFFLFTAMSVSALGNESENGEHNEGKFEPSSFILEHIYDSHEWHLLTKKDGESVSIYLPVILYSKEKGLSIFSSKRLSHGHEYNGYKIEEEGEFQGKIVIVDENGHIDEENMPVDLSMTKAVFGMLFAAIIGLLVFVSLARSYIRAGISAPGGIRSFLEPVILFIRDEIAIPNIGEHKYEKFMPYLLSVFFFILMNNIMGLIPFPPPFGANVTGNIAVTMTLALFTFVIIQINGTKTYWKHIYATPGVPIWLSPIMIPVEVVGMIAKPFALMVRLFANITGGHIIVMSLICLIFIFESLVIAPVSILFVIFMDCLELLVAFLQAYVFTLLSALFIGLATIEDH